jgi:hypothetical protein
MRAQPAGVGPKPKTTARRPLSATQTIILANTYTPVRLITFQPVPSKQ